MGFQLGCAALAPEMLYDVERATRPAGPILDFARRVAVMRASDLEAHLPQRWAARVVVNTDSERFEETVIGAPFDYDAPDLAQILRDKWRRLLPQDSGDVFENGRRDSAGRAVLWQRIEACVSMAARRGSEPEPITG
jgi:hypothetical protein